METPRIDGLRVTQTIGSGVTGTVYAAEDDHGQKVAVKVFQSMSIHRPLLKKMTLRLESGGWPAGVMPVQSADYDARPTLRITADYRDENGRPSSLQHRWGNDPTIVAWDLIRELAQALDSMHSRQVSHGNLKPGNIFLGESGEVLLTDWALGQMPGISHLEYTDAFLYQPPEQLLHPEGYLDEAGYRWDVYAFATISFRLLTGMFPRCDETFRKVAPPFGECKRYGIVADTQRIALGLEKETPLPWPTEASNSREKEYRDLLMQCLHLTAHERPASMTEVARRFEEIDARFNAEEHRDRLLDQCRRSNRRGTMLTIISGVLLASVVLASYQWSLSNQRWQNEKAQHQKDRDAQEQSIINAIELRMKAEIQREKELAAVQDEKTKAQDEKTKALQSVTNERNEWIEKLRASREVSDHLFEWAMTKGHRTLPPLDGQETRLKKLEAYYLQFTRESALLPELAEERARAQLQLAEISLALGDGKSASERFETALAALAKYPQESSWSLRMATNQLLLALLWQKTGDARSTEAFAQARIAIDALPKSAVDLDRIKQLRAILDYHEAKILADRGEAEKALEQLMRASTQLNELADVRPEATILRSELANCYLSSATVLEGMGQMGDARETRVLAVNELLTQLKKQPNDFTLRLTLASTYGAMAETSMLAGDVTSADQLSQNAIALLEKLIQEQPQHTLVATRLASQRIVVANLLEDRGEIAKARDAVDNGIKLIEGNVLAGKPDALTSFHYARLLWEKGRILSITNERKKGFALYQQALELLIPLSQQDHGALRADHIIRHIGYLHSDMGHAAQIDKNIDQAKRSFAASAEIWKDLLKLQPQNQEYQELLQWTQGRLKEL